MRSFPEQTLPRGRVILFVAFASCSVLLPTLILLQSLSTAADLSKAHATPEADGLNLTGARSEALSAEQRSTDARSLFAAAAACLNENNLSGALDAYSQAMRLSPLDIATSLPELRSAMDRNAPFHDELRNATLFGFPPPELAPGHLSAAFDLAGRLELDTWQTASREIQKLLREYDVRSHVFDVFRAMPERRPADLLRIVAHVLESEALQSQTTQHVLRQSLRADAAWRRARRFFEKAFNAQHPFRPSGLELARMASLEQRPDEAVRLWESLAEQSPLDVVASLATVRLAIASLEKGAAENARQQLDRVLRERPSESFAQMVAWVAESRCGQPISSLLNARSMAQNSRFTASDLAALAALRAQAGLLPDAAAALREALVSERAWADGHFNLAILSYLQGNHRQATDELRRALALEPDHAAARLYLACLLLQEHRYDEAAQESSELLAYHPSHSAGLLMRGVALACVGELEDSAATLSRVAADWPHAPLAQWYRSAVLAAAGRAEERISELEQQNGHSAVALNQIGFIHLAAGQLDAAEAAFRRSVALLPTDPTASLYLSRIALLKDDRLKAERALLHAMAAGADADALRNNFLALGKTDLPPPLLLVKSAPAPSGPTPAQIFFSVLVERSPNTLLRQMIALDLTSPMAAAALVALRRQPVQAKDFLEAVEDIQEANNALYEQLLDVAEQFSVEQEGVAPVKVASVVASWDVSNLLLLAP